MRHAVAGSAIASIGAVVVHPAIRQGQEAVSLAGGENDTREAHPVAGVTAHVAHLTKNGNGMVGWVSSSCIMPMSCYIYYIFLEK